MTLTEPSSRIRTTPVQTTSGALVGSIEEGVRVFRGVPYAASTAGPNRFLPPQPVPAWPGERTAFEFGDVAMQPNNAHPRYAVEGRRSEECLNLNVWAPEGMSADEPGLPVLVFFHGGGYMGGAGSVATYAGDHWARRGVIAVTLNYRLAHLGFLYLDELFEGVEQTGILGALDAAAGLRWVHENISAFGGDPARVTVAGSSAGGGIVNTLTGMPDARPHFQQALPISIGESATARGAEHDGETRARATASARVFLDYLGVEPGDLEALRAVPAERFLFTKDVWAFYADAGVPFALTPVPGTRGYPEHYFAALQRGDASGISLMSGVCLDEFGGRHTEAYGASESLQFQDVPMPRPKPGAVLDLLSLFPSAAETGSPTEDEITRVYSEELAAAGRPAEDVDVYLAAITDSVMLSAQTRRLGYQSAHNPHTYGFLFSWPSPMHGGILGAFHGVPSPMLFGRVDDPAWASVIGDEPPFGLADAYFDSMVAFVTTGTPAAAGLPDWPVYDGATRSTMVFDTVSRVVDNPLGGRLRLSGL